MRRIFDRLKFLARSYLNTGNRNRSYDSNDEDDSSRITDEEYQKIKDEWERDRITIHNDPALVKSYAVLGLPFGAGLDVVTKKWRELITRHHPDRFQDPKERERATKTSAEINEAYQKIKSFYEKQSK